MTSPVSGLHVSGLRTDLFGPIDLTLSRGEAIALLGPSGSGKTRILRAIADLDPAEGRVALDGRDRTQWRGPDWRRQVRYLASNAGWWGARVAMHFRDPQRAAGAGTALGLPDDCMARQVSQLSTGQLQRLALLRSIEDGPAVLLLDEPTAALDEAAVAAVEALLRGLVAGGTALLLVTHSTEQAGRLAHRRLHLMDGRLATAPAGRAAGR